MASSRSAPRSTREPPRDRWVPWRDAAISVSDVVDEAVDAVVLVPTRAAEDAGTADSHPVPATTVRAASGTTRAPHPRRRWCGVFGMRNADLRGLAPSARCLAWWRAKAANSFVLGAGHFGARTRPEISAASSEVPQVSQPKRE